MLVQLGLHGIHVAAVLLGQQCQQVKGLAAVHAKQQFSIRSRQHGRCAVGGRLVGVQHVLGQGAVGGLAVIAHGLHAGGLAVLGCQQVAHVGAHGQCQPALLAGALDASQFSSRAATAASASGVNAWVRQMSPATAHPRTARRSGLPARPRPCWSRTQSICRPPCNSPMAPGASAVPTSTRMPRCKHVPAGQRQRTLDGQRGQHI